MADGKAPHSQHSRMSLFVLSAVSHDSISPARPAHAETCAFPGRSSSPQTPNIVNELPYLVVRQDCEGHHAGSRRAVFNNPEELPIRDVFHHLAACEIPWRRDQGRAQHQTSDCRHPPRCPSPSGPRPHRGPGPRACRWPYPGGNSRSHPEHGR